MKIAVIDKAPSKTKYEKYFNFEFELYHMSSVPITKLLKKDVDLEIDLDEYDLVILVGSEAAKEYAKITSVINFQGQLVKDKFVCISNPAVLIFKPEGKQDFDRALEKIHKYISEGLDYATVKGDFKGIIDRDEAKDFLLEVLSCQEEFVAVDTEGTALYPRKGHVIGVSLSYKPQYGRYITTDIMDEELIDIFQQIINSKTIIFHNLKYDYKMLEYHLGVKFRDAYVHDTMVMHYVLDENSPHGLKALALKYTKYGDYDSELSAFIKNYCSTHGILQDDFTWDLIPFEIISIYASIDPTVTLELFHKFWPKVQSNAKLLYVYKELLIKGTLFFHRMEEVGIPFDRQRLIAASKYLTEQIDDAKKELYTFEELRSFEEVEGIIFNPNSVIQLRKLLFDYVGLTPTGIKTATGADSLDADALEELAKEHKLPETLLKIRKLTKLLNTYVSKLVPQIDRDGRIRTNFNLIFTTSGRASSSGVFNAQQIPRDDPIIKGCIVAPPGYVIVSQDLSTAEMYYAAVLSGDKNLMAVFQNKSGADFHSTIAHMVFSLPCDPTEVKTLYPALRQSAKAISFGILYGSGPKKVAETVSDATKEYYSVEQAKEDINTYFSRFKQLKKWLKSRDEFIRANGYTYSFFGRKRRLLNVFSDDKGIAAHEVRSGINSEIQSLASDINLLAAIDTQEEVNKQKLDANIFMLVHDSIVAIVREDCVEEYKRILKECTQKDRGCSIPGAPIGIDQEVGNDYSFGKYLKTYKLEGDTLSVI